MLSRRSPHKFAGLYFSIQLFLGWFIVTNLILNLLSTSSTLSCRRVRSYPPNCFIITSQIIGSEQVKELPNGQLTGAKLRTEGFLTLTSEAVILETTEGEIRFSPRRKLAGGGQDFDQQINSFLRSTEVDSIELWSGYESSFNVLFKIFGIISLVLAVNVYQAFLTLKRPPKHQEQSTFDQWAETSDRLSSLEHPTSKEIKLPSSDSMDK